MLKKEIVGVLKCVLLDVYIIQITHTLEEKNMKAADGIYSHNVHKHGIHHIETLHHGI